MPRFVSSNAKHLAMCLATGNVFSFCAVELETSGNIHVSRQNEKRRGLNSHLGCIIASTLAIPTDSNPENL
jgi:hypothetical protein